MDMASRAFWKDDFFSLSESSISLVLRQPGSSTVRLFNFGSIFVNRVTGFSEDIASSFLLFTLVGWFELDGLTEVCLINLGAKESEDAFDGVQVPSLEKDLLISFFVIDADLSVS